MPICAINGKKYFAQPKIVESAPPSTFGSRISSLFGRSKAQVEAAQTRADIAKATDNDRQRYREEQNKTLDQSGVSSNGGARTKGRLTNKNKRRSRKYKKTASHRKKSSRRRDIRRSLRRIH